MNKTPIEFLIDHYGCEDEVDLQNYLGENVSIVMITEVMEEYAEFYHQSELRKREAEKSAFVTLDMDDMERWNIDSA